MTAHVAWGCPGRPLSEDTLEVVAWTHGSTETGQRSFQVEGTDGTKARRSLREQAGFRNKYAGYLEPGQYQRSEEDTSNGDRTEGIDCLVLGSKVIRSLKHTRLAAAEYKRERHCCSQHTKAPRNAGAQHLPPCHLPWSQATHSEDTAQR